MGLSKIAIHRPVAMTMVFLGILLIGAVSVVRLPIELMPDIALKDISIIVRIRGGIPAPEVESLVTRPIEEAVGGVSYLRELLSISEEGESRVILRFEPGINMDFAALEVREKFSRVEDELPREIERPIIAKYRKTDMPIIIFAMTGEGFTPEMLRRIADEQIKENFMRVEGVANVEVAGGRERKILVEADQQALLAHNISLGKVINALNLNNLTMLSGDVDRIYDEYLIRTVGEFASISHIRNIGIAVTPHGSIIRLGDVATVKDSFLEPIDLARVDVKPVVSLFIQKESAANTTEVAEKVMEELERIRLTVDERIIFKATYNQAEYIQSAITTVRTSLLWGGVLAVFVLFLFLRDFRPTFILGFTIPLSVMATFAFMFFQGLSLNIMTLSGIALGIGMLVDSSIVVLENIFKKREQGLSKYKSALEGSQEVTLAIVASTITTVVVFLPIVFVSKEVRLMYSGLAFTVAFALIASLFIALTLVPLLSSRIPMGRKVDAKLPTRSHFFIKLKTRYRRCLGLVIRYRYIFIFVAFGLFVGAIFLSGRIGKEFTGIAEQSKFTVHVELPTGARLKMSDRCVKEVERVLEKVPEVRTISSRIERWSSDIHVKLYPAHKRTRSVSEIIDSLRPLTDRIEPRYDAFIYFEEPQAVGTREIFIDIFGYDYGVLKQLAISVATKLQAVPEFSDIKIRMRAGRPELGVSIDRKRAALYGLSVKDIATTIHGKIRGLRATYYHTQAREVEVVARLQPEDRKDIEDIRNLVLTTPEGDPLFLNQVATLRFDIGPSEIWRKNRERMVQVSASRGILSLDRAGERVKETLRALEFPEDYFYKLGGDYEKMLRNQREFKAAIILTLILIFLVLASLFESYIQPFIIMAAVPLAVIGVMVALYITNTSITVGALIGMMMLGGIVVNDSIVLVDLVNRLKKDKNFSQLKAIIKAGEDRLRPILMTSVTTILGLLPMALDKSEAATLWVPLAIAVIGGLFTATILTLFIVPSMYMVIDDMRRLFKKVESRK